MNDDVVTSLFRTMAIIRRFEENLLDLFSLGKVSGTTHACLGQEAIAVAAMAHIYSADAVFSNHRCHGHYIGYGGDAWKLLAEITGRADGVCGGRGGSQHLCHGRFFTNGVQGGMVPCAAGYALANSMRRLDGITVAFIGDGTWGEGIVYESLNMASLWRIPVLIVVEDNGYAQTTPTQKGRAGGLAARVTAFGIDYNEVETNDVVELYSLFERAFAFVRENRRPYVQIVRTYRLGPHSKGDDFRDPGEKEAWLKKDPLVLARKYLDAAEADQILEEAGRTVEELSRDVLVRSCEDKATLDLGLSDILRGSSREGWDEACPESGKFGESLNAALHHIFAKCPEAALIGEDVADPYGGAFKVTRGLSTAFPNRVFSSPISEAGIAGLANGMALNGMRPIVEVMFGDFVTLMSDQIINHGAKFKWMYNNQVDTPVLIRLPSGGIRGYGPTHSQSMERLFMGFPNISVIAPTHYHDPGRVLCALYGCMDALALFVENKGLYTETIVRPREGRAGKFLYAQAGKRFPTIRLRTDGDEPGASIICYGGGLSAAIDAAWRFMIETETCVEIVCPSLVSPIPFDDIRNLLSPSSERVIVVDESYAAFGWAGEVALRVMESDRALGLSRSVERVGLYPSYLSSCKEVEALQYPSSADIVRLLSGQGLR